MDIEKQLKTVGFEEKEIKIYLACLHLGQDTAFHIAKKSGLKRSTAYFVLNILVEKGIVGVKQTKKATLYSPANPKKILTQIQQKETILKDILPSLEAIYNARPEKPSIQIFEGKEGIRQIYTEAIEFLKKKKEVIFYGDIKHMDDFPDLMNFWLGEIKNKSYRIKELLNNNELNGFYIKEMRKIENPNHYARVISKDTQPFSNDNAIYGNKLVIFSTTKKLFAIVIESEDIVNSYRIMFNSIWEKAKKAK